MAPSKKAPALKKRKRERLASELDSGPQVDQRRDDIMRNMLRAAEAARGHEAWPENQSERAAQLKTGRK
jgi:hypothetical protein